MLRISSAALYLSLGLLAACGGDNSDVNLERTTRLPGLQIGSETCAPNAPTTLSMCEWVLGYDGVVFGQVTAVDRAFGPYLGRSGRIDDCTAPSQPSLSLDINLSVEAAAGIDSDTATVRFGASSANWCPRPYSDVGTEWGWYEGTCGLPDATAPSPGLLMGVLVRETESNGLLVDSAKRMFTVTPEDTLRFQPLVGDACGATIPDGIEAMTLSEVMAQVQTCLDAPAHERFAPADNEIYPSCSDPE